MTLRSLTPEDIDWAAGLLAERRIALESAAPIMWRPAKDTRKFFATWVQETLQLGGHGYRTDDSVLIAGVAGSGLHVDDSVIAQDDWEGTGAALWSELTKDAAGQQVRFVCPAAEPERSRFAVLRAMDLADTWWLREIGAEGGEAGRTVDLPGTTATTIPAPAGYDSRGPVLFLDKTPDSCAAVSAAAQNANERGCSAVIVSDDGLHPQLADALKDNGFHPHCLFFDTTL